MGQVLHYDGAGFWTTQIFDQLSNVLSIKKIFLLK